MRSLLTLTAERGMAGHLIAATLGHEDERTTIHAYAVPGSAAAGAHRRSAGRARRNRGTRLEHAEDCFAAIRTSPVLQRVSGASRTCVGRAADVRQPITRRAAAAARAQ